MAGLSRLYGGDLPGMIETARIADQTGVRVDAATLNDVNLFPQILPDVAGPERAVRAPKDSLVLRALECAAGPDDPGRVVLLREVARHEEQFAGGLAAPEQQEQKERRFALISTIISEGLPNMKPRFPSI